MGTPVLTLPGRSFASRVCASLVTAAGVPEFVCASAEDYVAQAIALGRDPQRLRAYRARLLALRESSTLFDTQGHVRALEQNYREMWADFVADRLPRPDLTNLDAYLDVGIAIATGRCPDWSSGLAARDAFAPLPPDRRLWSGR